MTWDKKIASMLAIGGTLIVELLGGWDMAIYVLLLFMVIDYLTGIMRAIKDKELSSAIGINGIFKKMMILFIIAVAVGIDDITGTDGAIRMLAILFYAGMEGISILENAARLGVPVPDKLKDVLLQLKEGNRKAEITTTTTTAVTTDTVTETAVETITKQGE